MKYTSVIMAGCALMIATAAIGQTKKTPVRKPAAKSATAKKPASKVSFPAKRIKTTPDGFTVGNGDLEYKVVKQGTGTYTPQPGDIMEMNIKFKIGDSVLINTLEMNNNEPVSQPCQKPAFVGDLNEGLMMMKSGDSMIFRMLMDTLAARAKQPKPEWAKPGDYASWEVKMVNVKNKAAFEAEKEAKGKVQAEKEDATLQAYFAEKQLQPQKTPTGLYYIIHQPGEGAHPEAGNSVTVNYTGMLLDGTKFDSNVDPQFNHVQPFNFPIGQRRVIKGWDEGVALLKKGGKMTLYIPSGLAYGERSPSPKIPANAIMIFDIELVDFK